MPEWEADTVGTWCLHILFQGVLQSIFERYLCLLYVSQLERLEHTDVSLKLIQEHFLLQDKISDKVQGQIYVWVNKCSL